MDSSFQFSETYLFKVHVLNELLNKLFDRILREYAQTTLSQFTLLLAVAEHGTINQRRIARFLEISPAAVNRQVELARQQGLLSIEQEPKGRGHIISVTPAGRTIIRAGMQSLEQKAFHIFADENRQTSLMDHIDLLFKHAKEITPEK